MNEFGKITLSTEYLPDFFFYHFRVCKKSGRLCFLCTEHLVHPHSVAPRPDERSDAFMHIRDQFEHLSKKHFVLLEAATGQCPTKTVNKELVEKLRSVSHVPHQSTKKHRLQICNF